VARPPVGSRSMDGGGVRPFQCYFSSSPSTSSTSGEYLLELPYHLQQGKEGRGRPDVDRPRCTGTGRWTHDAWTGQASGDL